MIGRTVGNYRIVEKIGEGGMGTVYRAVDLMLERDVALKAIRPELSREPQIAERFRAEAKILARISHPAIANVYTFFYEGDELFLAMELVRGRSLARALQDGPIPWQRAVLLLAAALEGIEQAHRAGIVHRDLKPDNLMLTESGSVKVMDFGIARVMGSGHLTRTGLLVGTLRYMAPEQIRGEEVDGRADIYALGAVLYEMLTARSPFEGGSDWAILKAQMEDMPRPPGETVPAIPWWLDRAVLRALAKHPSERFQTVEEMRLALLRQGETLERPPGAPFAIEDLPTVVTPPRQSPPQQIMPPPTLPLPAPLPGLPTDAHFTAASTQTPQTPQTPPPAHFAATPPPPPTAALHPSPMPQVPQVPQVPPPVPPAQSPGSSSYRPVELSRAKGGTGRKIAIAAAAVLAFIGLAFVALLALGSLTGTNPESPAGDAAASSATAEEAASTAPASEAAPDGEQQTAAYQPPSAAPSTEPASAPRTANSAPPLPRPAPQPAEPPAEPAVTSQPAAPEPEPAATAETPAEPLPSSGQGPLEELHRLASDLPARSSELVEAYAAFLSKKEDSGAELTDQDNKLKDDLDAFQESAEKFNDQFQVGRFARIWGRRADDRRRIHERFREMARLGGEVESLMNDVRPGPEVRRAWFEVRRRWKRVGEIVGGL